MRILYIDAYHLADALFLQALARALAAAGPAAGPVLLLHGSGEAADRALEAEGLFLERRDGLFTTASPVERAVIERAAREANRRLAGILTDALVHAVRVIGVDRGLLRQDAGGRPVPGATGWLRTVLRSGGVPVVSSLAMAPDGSTVEVHPLAVAAELARSEAAFQESLVLFPRDPRTVAPAEGVEKLRAGQAAHILQEPEERLRDCLSAGLNLLLADVRGAVAAEKPLGTAVITDK